MSKFNNKFFSNIWVFGYEMYGFYSRISNKYTPYMNLGFNLENNVDIDTEDDKFQSNINLYNKILNNTDLSNSSVLEIGCGRGGGCYFIHKYKKASTVFGLDKSKQNIKLCGKYFSNSNYTFKIGDATNFNLNKKFDFIVNLESSHSYPNRVDFYNCVKDALKEDAQFFYADIFNTSELNEVEDQLENVGLNIVKKENITDGVVKSIEDNSMKWFPFATKHPKLTPKFFKVFTVSIHSDIFKGLKNGELHYYSYVIKK